MGIKRGSTRFVERESGRVTRHSFAFGSDYDPARLEFGPMVCHDDHLLGPGRGFPTHRHSGLEIVTYVVSGALRHADSTGSESVVPARSVAVLSTGDGVEHSEFATDDGPCRFVQVWLRSESGRREPTYDGSPRHVPRLPRAGCAAAPDAALGLGGLAGRAPGATWHVYVVTGALLRSSLAEPLSAGDAFEMTDEPVHSVAAGVPTELPCGRSTTAAPVLMGRSREPGWPRARRRVGDRAAGRPIRLMGDHGGAFLGTRGLHRRRSATSTTCTAPRAQPRALRRTVQWADWERMSGTLSTTHEADLLAGCRRSARRTSSSCGSDGLRFPASS